MKTKMIFLLAGILLTQSLYAQVIAQPSYQDLGTVAAGQTRFAQVTFFNESPQTIQFLNAYCTGDFGNFSCSSVCFNLQPHGTCSVQVYFRPEHNDGMRRSVTVIASGGTGYAQATLTGTDAAPTPTPSPAEETSESTQH